MLAGMQTTGNPLTLLVGMKAGTATLENSMEVPQKLKAELPNDPAIALLRIYPKDKKVVIGRGNCIPMFTAILFI